MCNINFSDDELKALQEWDMILRNISDFVRIAVVNGIRFEVYTNEKGSHNWPHLHVSTSSASLSITIDDGTILAQSGRLVLPKLSKRKSG